MAIYALTPHGAQLGQYLASKLSGELFLPESLAADQGCWSFTSIKSLVAEQFFEFRAHVFITAAGIAVRCIAAHIVNKQSDPAVVVMDQRGKYVISLLSGHLGKANELALSIAGLTKGQAVITTATDTLDLPGLDVLAQKQGLRIGDLKALREVSAALVRGEKIQLYDPGNWLLLSEAHKQYFEKITDTLNWLSSRAGVWVDWHKPGLGTNQLLLHPPALFAGIGCNRGTSGREILELIQKTFAEHGLALHSLAGIASIEQKSDEQGLLQVAEKLGLDLHFYPGSELKAMNMPNPSEVVHRYMGVYSVCEAAACKLAGSDHLIVSKVKSLNATLAIALVRAKS